MKDEITRNLHPDSLPTQITKTSESKSEISGLDREKTTVDNQSGNQEITKLALAHYQDLVELEKKISSDMKENLAKWQAEGLPGEVIAKLKAQYEDNLEQTQIDAAALAYQTLEAHGSDLAPAYRQILEKAAAKYRSPDEATRVEDSKAAEEEMRHRYAADKPTLALLDMPGWLHQQLVEGTLNSNLSSTEQIKSLKLLLAEAQQSLKDFELQIASAPSQGPEYERLQKTKQEFEDIIKAIRQADRDLREEITETYVGTDLGLDQEITQAPGLKSKTDTKVEATPPLGAESQAKNENDPLDMVELGRKTTEFRKIHDRFANLKKQWLDLSSDTALDKDLRQRESLAIYNELIENSDAIADLRRENQVVRSDKELDSQILSDYAETASLLLQIRDRLEELSFERAKDQKPEKTALSELMDEASREVTQVDKQDKNK